MFSHGQLSVDLSRVGSEWCSSYYYNLPSFPWMINRGRYAELIEEWSVNGRRMRHTYTNTHTHRYTYTHTQTHTHTHTHTTSTSASNSTSYSCCIPIPRMTNATASTPTTPTPTPTTTIDWLLLRRLLRTKRRWGLWFWSGNDEWEVLCKWSQWCEHDREWWVREWSSAPFLRKDDRGIVGDDTRVDADRALDGCEEPWRSGMINRDDR